MTFEELDNARLAYKKRMVKLIQIFIAIFAIIAIFVIAMAIGSNDDFSALMILPMLLQPAFFLLIIAIIVIVFATHKQALAYKKTYKAYFVAATLAKIFTDLKYSHDLGYPKAAIAATGMMRMGDRYHSNDFVSGRYKNIAFSQADVHIEDEYTDSDGDTHYVTIFKGRFLTFEFNRDFSFKLQVAHKNFGNNCLPRGKEIRKFEKIEVESPNFNKKFNIYGQDGFEAFYLLDPAFLEKIEQLGDNCGGRIMLMFMDNKLHIALYDGKDSLEPPSPFKEIDEQAELQKVSSDIKIITDFIDKLTLDKYAFKKTS